MCYETENNYTLYMRFLRLMFFFNKNARKFTVTLTNKKYFIDNYI